jgi:hypothetical protein
MKKRFFDSSELKIVDQSVLLAEDLVNNYFKLSSSQWLKNRYDIKTGEALLPHEQVTGPFAQVLKYEGRRQGECLGSSVYSLYAVCLQDSAILDLVVRRSNIHLPPFLLYVLIHELVHVVRFLRFEHRYESTSESDVTFEEEKKVHELTRKIIVPVAMAGVGEVLEFFKDWYSLAAEWPGGENFE